MSNLPAVSKILQSKLQKSDPEVQSFIEALHKKITKLFKEKADLEVDNISLHHRIDSLEARVKVLDKNRPNIEKLANEELIKLIEEKVKG
jgi:cell division protein FtsB